jgi:hypothetical protein
LRPAKLAPAVLILPGIIKCPCPGKTAVMQQYAATNTDMEKQE